MMNTEFLQTVSIYEISRSFIFVFGVTIAFSLLAIYATNDRRAGLMVFLSLITTTILSLLSLYVLFIMRSVTLNNRYYFAAWLPFMTVLFTLLLLSSEYRNLKGTKRFDVDFVSRYHFDISLQTGLVMSLLTLVIFPFVTRELSFIVAVSTVLTVVSLSVTHAFVRRFIKE